MNFQKRKKVLISLITIATPLIVLPVVSCSTSSTSLESEVERLNCLSDSIKSNEPIISPKKYTNIDEEFILKNFGKQLNLNTSKFVYKVENISKEYWSDNKTGELSFKLKVANRRDVHDPSKFKLVNNKFIVLYHVKLQIISVSILGLKDQYTDGDTSNPILLKSNVIMADDSEIPKKLNYSWFLDNKVVSTEPNLSMPAKFEDNGKKIKLRVSFNGDYKETDEFIINVKRTPQQMLDLEKERILNLNPNISLKNSNINQADFDAITEANILEQINIELNKSEFEYQVVNFSNTQGQIKFKINVGNKDLNNFQPVDKEFIVKFK